MIDLELHISVDAFKNFYWRSQFSLELYFIIFQENLHMLLITTTAKNSKSVQNWLYNL